MAHGKLIELFLVNGTADSLVTAELSNWNGKAIKIPRIEVSACQRDDIAQAGVYFLFCKEDDGSDSVYIGEAENIKERLIQHLRDYQAEKEMYYWNTAVLFIENDLNKASIRYLENRFVEIARNSKRYVVLTKNTYKNTVMKESQIDVMEEFIDNVRVLINALGYKVLEPLVLADKVNDNDSEKILYMNTSTVNASGKVTPEGFVVFAGSKLSETITTSLAAGFAKTREKLIEEGKIKGTTIIEDILFSSSSAAAAILNGYNTSGPRYWKNKDGRTLKEIENTYTNK